jgi:hypothetical protein
MTADTGIGTPPIADMGAYEFARAALTIYGCGPNPSGSLVHLSGTPDIGETIELGLDNPLGTQAAGSLPLLVLSTLPDAAFPCGTPVPGFGMGGGPGELLIGLAPPNPLLPFLVGPPWLGPGMPSVVPLALPSSPTLVGRSFYAQGVLFDPFSALRFGLTEALRITIGH